MAHPRSARIPLALSRPAIAPRFLLRPCQRTSFHTTAPNAFGNRPHRVSSSGSPVLLEQSKAAALLRRQLPDRTGALAYKRGMTSIFTPSGERIPATILQLDRVQVASVKTRQDHGYWALQIGCGWRNPRNITRPMLGHYEKCGVAPKPVMREFRVKGEEGLMKPGTEIKADHFIEGQYVDVRANTKGKGFAGGMKRWGFTGQPASHGTSKVHRAMGSAGQSQGGGSRVLPGKKMAGRLGGTQQTTQNLKVLRVESELGIVLVKGAVSGPKNCIVELQDAKKRSLPDAPATDLR